MSYSDQAHFGNYDPSTFGWPHRVPDLVPFTFQGVNFGTCARAVHPVFVALLTELAPHIPGGINFGPKDDWAYSATDDLPDGSWSFHRYGIAFDLNWRENPMGNYTNNPDAGDKGAIPYATAVRIARNYGCEYGGSWSGGANRLGFKDFMHFECHLSPQIAHTVRLLDQPEGVFTVDAAAKARFDAIDKEIADLKEFVHGIFSVQGHQYSALTVDQIAEHPVVAKLEAIAAKLGGKS